MTAAVPPDPVPDPAPESPGLLPPSRRRRLLEAWALLCLVLLVRAFADGWLRGTGAAVVPGAVAVAIDLNRAGLPELLAVPGLGPVRAEALILHRVRHGWFRSVDELDAVDGIGPVVLAAIRPHVCVRPPDVSRSDPAPVPAGR